MIVMQQISK